MNSVELVLLGVAAVGLVLWIRGCVKYTLSTCILGLLLAVVAAGGYFVAFSLTRRAYLAAGWFVPFAGVMLCMPSLLRRPMGKGLLAIAIVMCAAAALVEYRFISLGNALLVIEPYRSGSIWRFDEPLLHLKGEPFVQGIPEMIDKMVEGVPGSDRAVRLTFSQRPFPGWKYRLDRRQEQDGGNWYYNETWNMEGWLCPALFKFFPRAPQHIYVKAESV